MEYFQIQGDTVTINLSVFILSLIIPLIIGILLTRYIPKICEIFERKLLEFGSYLKKKCKNGITFLVLYNGYRKISSSTSNCPKQILESISTKITSETGKKFVSEHDLEKGLINCLGSEQLDVLLISLKNLRIIINTKGPDLQLRHEEISKIIELLSITDENVRKSVLDTLKLLAERGIRKELMIAMKDERNPEIEFQLASLCRYFLETFTPEEFIDDETIEPIFRFLEYDNGTLRYNLLGGLWNCANKKLLKMSHIIRYDTKKIFRTILEGNIVDQRLKVLSILTILAKHQDQQEIINSGFLPLLIRNLSETNDAVRNEADNVLHELLKCEETKQVTDAFLTESNVKGLLMTRFTIKL